MKNLTLITLLLISLTITLFSCDEKPEDTDTTPPTIVIHTPNASQTFMSGDTVNIHIEVTDNDEIHEIAASLNRTHMGATVEVWHVHAHPDAASHTLNAQYIVEVPGMHNDFVLEVVSDDHTGNSKTETFEFHVMQ